MAAAKRARTKVAGSVANDTSEKSEVDAYLGSLDHAHKPAIMALRQMILDAHPDVAEGIKWNVPSFRTSEWFATFHLRAKVGVQLIFHLGAKKRSDLGGGLMIDDPAGMLTWLGEDRAAIRFVDLDDVAAQRDAFVALVRAWIARV